MKDETELSHRERLLRVLLYLQKHLHDELDLDTLAKIGAYSSFHFHRIFHAHVGESLAQYIRRLRIEHAAGSLSRTDRSIIEIAFECGYESHEAFSRAFKRQFSCSPKTFRKEHRLVVEKELFKPLLGEVVEEVVMDVRIEKIEPQRVAFIRHVGPYDQVGNVWEKLCLWAAPKGLLGPGIKMLGISYDDPSITDADKLRYEAAITVDDSIAAEGEVGIQTIYGGEYAVVTHQGAYTKLSESYNWLYRKWLKESKREPAHAPCFEWYINDPESTPEDELLTDIYLPLSVQS